MALKNKRKKTKTKKRPAITGGAGARTKRKGAAVKEKKVSIKNIHDSFATGLINFVLPTDEMPSQLVEYKDRHRSQTGNKSVEPTIIPTEALQKIFPVLRNQTEYDFSQYKFSTINRRRK